MYLRSAAYSDGETMPSHLAATQVAGGLDVSVPLDWDGEPANTRSFVLAMIDHHPIAHGWVHWLVVDIPHGVHALAQGVSVSDSMPEGAVELLNTGRRRGYGGPRPPIGSGVHEYVTTIYALDLPRLDVHPDASWEDVRTEMSGHVVDEATLFGGFER